MSQLLAIDQGTSSTKVLIFDKNTNVISKQTSDLETEYLHKDWVEQDPEAIYASVIKAVKELDISKVSCVGISNQRETFVLWDVTGTIVHNAVVWSCKRSTSLCQTMLDQNDWIQKKTGLIIDPYFSGTKLLWIIETYPKLKERIQKGEIYFGTVDSWVLYKLTHGQSYFTDTTNASRTLLFNIHTLDWDQEIIDRWGLTGINLPEVKTSAAFFGETNFEGLSSKMIPITAMIGDSHAALFGEGCFSVGDTKMTLGTGCSILSHIGNTPKISTNGLLTTIAYSTPLETVYAWEGAIVSCGSMISWLKNSLGLIESVQQTEHMAFEAAESDLYLIPAFSGLGAPFWQMERKASLVGMTFGTTNNQIVRAALESISYQIVAVLDSMKEDLGSAIETVAINGGLSKNKFVQHELNNLISATLEMQKSQDVSALGAALLAGLQIKMYDSLVEIKSLLHKNTLKKESSSASHMNKFQSWKNIIQTNTL